MADKIPKDIDPEMLENLDLLLNLDIVENEDQWEVIEHLEEIDAEEKEVEDES